MRCEERPSPGAARHLRPALAIACFCGAERHNRGLDVSPQQDYTMSVIDQLGKRGAVALGVARDAVDAASPKLKQWMKTGAALGAARTGARIARGVVRRNPGLALAAAAVGAGYLAYTAYRKHAVATAAYATHSDTAPIDSTATVIETRGRGASARRKAASTAATANDDAAKRATKRATKPAAKRARKRSATA